MKAPDEPCDGNCRRGNIPCRTGDPPSGIRLVAFFEASKGALVLAAGFGLFELVHRNIRDVAEELVRRFHHSGDAALLSMMPCEQASVSRVGKTEIFDAFEGSELQRKFR